MKVPIIFRRVVGVSMWPTLLPHQIIAVSGWMPIRMGAIVVAMVEGQEVIKRVAKKQNEWCELLGDNSDTSRDSRHYGWIHQSAIKGRVIGFPPSHIGHAKFARSIGL